MIKNGLAGSTRTNLKKYLSLVALGILLIIVYSMCQQRPTSTRSPKASHVVAKDDDGTDQPVETLYVDMHDIERWPPPHPSTMNDRWIVVTSIFAPTPDVKKLSQIPGWKLVVVGDMKSPRHWKADGVVFLSIDDQHGLGFETVDYLNYSVYQRKNIGYLYAVYHGAKYIYDTDDDNHPYHGVLNFHERTAGKEYLVYHNKNRTFYNAFPHFGQSTLWPRGLPLDEIDKEPVRTYKKCNGLKVMVQQGVVDGDPDVDAIQRLTRKDRSAKFVVYFDRNAPPVVFPTGSYAPYNSQNTLHLYDSFFSLLLPQTVTFRVNDIWRSYITQRLLQDIGGHVAYFPPNAYQLRNPHNFLQDFYEEYDLYHKTHLIVRTLQQWKGKGRSMLSRHLEVVKQLHRAGILGSLDVHLARAWCRDLIRVGYMDPQVDPEHSTSSVKCEAGVTTFVPVEMPTIFNRIGQKNVNVVKMAINASFMVP